MFETIKEIYKEIDPKTIENFGKISEMKCRKEKPEILTAGDNPVYSDGKSDAEHFDDLIARLKNGFAK